MINSNSYSNFRPYLNTNENLTKWQQFRLYLFEFMFNPSTYISKWCAFLITFTIMVAVTGSCLETLESVNDLLFWKILELCCSVIFIIEYILKMVAVKDHLNYIKTTGHFIDFASIIPIFFILTSNISDIVGFLKILKLFRITKVLSSNSMKVYKDLLVETLSKSLYGLKLMFFLIVIVMIFSSTILYEIEKGIREDGTNPFSSIPATFYWSIVTVTTVGYGDIYPITDIGKLMAGLTMLMGIIIIALPITIISKNFSTTWDEFENRGLIKVRNNCIEAVSIDETNTLKLKLIHHCSTVINLNQLTETERTIVQTLLEQMIENLCLIGKIRGHYLSSESFIELEQIYNDGEDDIV